MFPPGAAWEPGDAVLLMYNPALPKEENAVCFCVGQFQAKGHKLGTHLWLRESRGNCRWRNRSGVALGSFGKVLIGLGVSCVEKADCDLHSSEAHSADV